MVTLPPGSSLGRYRIVEQLGRGGMATVFRAHDPTLDRHVAIKVLPSYGAEDPTFTARFAQEAQTIARMTHPNILQIYDFGEDKGFSYLVSELVNGGSLQDKLRGNPLKLEEAVEFLGPLADALDYAHSQGVVHRDIKPPNVLLDEKSRPILADFGLARMLESAARFTLAQQALGTPEYMSPEQAMGADADHRSDIYAFGILAYQMLLGETPFHADTPAATLMAHVHQPLPLPSSLNPEIEPRVEACLLKSLARDPNDRFQTASEFVRSLAPPGSPRAGSVRLDDAETLVVDVSSSEVTEGFEAATARIDEVAADGVAEPIATDRPAAQSPPAAAAEAGPVPFAIPGHWLAAGAGVATVAVVVAVVLVLLLSGGDDGDAVVQADDVAVGADAGTGEPVQVATGEADAGPDLTLAEAVAALETLTSRAENNVVNLRGLSPTTDREPIFRTSEQLETITKGLFRRESLRQLIFETGELYKVLGLLEIDQDLEEILIGIQTQQVRALFDPEADATYVLSDATSLGPIEELGYAAAFLSGLLQDEFDVATVRERATVSSLDEARALDALLRGDLFQTAQGYVSTVMTAEQVAELSRPLADNLLAAAPDVVRRANRFLDQEGAAFVAALFDSGGWDAVNAAYGQPPVSTEQIIHPEKYFADEGPSLTTVPNLSASLGKGWSEVSGNTLGEFLLRTHLEEYLDGAQAAAGVEGWGGDRYSLLSGPEGQLVMVAIIKWDTDRDSTEFFDVYQEFAGAKGAQTGGSVSDLSDSGRLWYSPAEATFLGISGQSTLLIIGDTRETVGQILTFVDLLFQSQDEFVP